MQSLHIHCCCLVFKLCLTLLESHGLLARQAPLSMGFPGKNTGVGCHFLFQGVFPTQGSNLCLLRWQTDSLSLSHQGSPVCTHTINTIQYVKIMCVYVSSYQSTLVQFALCRIFNIKLSIHSENKAYMPLSFLK